MSIHLTGVVDIEGEEEVEGFQPILSLCATYFEFKNVP